MLKIGVTGGIGSGKSTVCSIFAQLGIPIYNSDTRARELMIEKGSVVEKIKSEFGDEAYINGQLNRKYISSIAFYDPSKLEKLNTIVHPAVFEDFREWTEKHKNARYVIKEAALLFESGSYKELDYLVNVNAPVDVRLRRVLTRDGISEDEIRKRMAAQWDDEKRTRYSQYTINNDGLQMLLPQVLQLHKIFSELSGKR